MQPTKKFPQLFRAFSVAAAAVKPFTSIPGPKSIPPYGTYGAMVQQAAITSATDVLTEYYKKYSPVMRHDLGPLPIVWVFDPELGRKFVLNEGTYPKTAASDMWPIAKYFEERKMKLGLTSVGPEWRDLRTALQKDIFPPAIAESYLPILAPVVKDISKVLPRISDLSEAINYAAFDMFLSVMVGLFPRTTQSLVGEKADPEDIKFVQDAIVVIAKIIQAYMEPHVPEHYKHFSDAHDRVIARGKHYLRVAAESKVSLPVEPYITRLVNRKEMDEEGLIHALSQFLFAGVDTTATVLMILLIDLAENPGVQEKLYQEIKREIGEGSLSPDNIRGMKYLNYVLRESHRLHPSNHLTLQRRLPKEIQLGGYSIPEDTRVILCQTPIQNDPAIVDDPEKFIPDRWSPEAVAKRAGTPKEVLDHRLLQDPFGFGPRMCLGARVAKSEIKAIVCQLLQDWKFEVAPGQKYAWGGFPGFTRAVPYPKFTWRARK